MAEDTPNEQTPDLDVDAAEDAHEEEPQHPVQVETEDAGTLRKRVTVTVPRARIDEKFDEMFGELSESAQVPGFRIGRAPRRLIEKRFGSEISDDVRNGLIGEALGEAMDKADLGQTIGEPDLELDGIELPDRGDLEFSFEVEVAPEFDLPDLDGIRVEEPEAGATDEQVEEYLENIRQGRARYEETDEAAEEGDMVLADVTITGEGIEPVERAGEHLRVAPGQIEGVPVVELTDALKGKKAGDAADLTLTVPESHPNEDWQGKELKIDIAARNVQHRIVPELDDALAESMGSESVDEAREFIRERLEQRAQSQRERQMQEQIREYLLENTDLEVPPQAAARHTQSVFQRQAAQLMQQGVPRELIEERIAELQAAAGEQAQRELKLQFILNKVMEQLDVSVDEGELNSRIAGMAQMYNRRPERLRQELEQDGTLDQIRHTMAEEKALNALLDRAEFVEPEQTDESDESDESDEGDEDND